MIGEVLQIAGQAAALASQFIPDKKITDKRVSYMPDSNSFRYAGLYNGSVFDYGEDKDESTFYRAPLTKRYLEGVGGIAQGVGSIISGGGATGKSGEGSGLSLSDVSKTALKVGLAAL